MVFMRNNPFFAPSGFIATVLLMFGLAVTLWRSGGKAFSPGRLSAVEKPGLLPGGFSSHAEFESECQRCHLPLETTQNTLCLDCHNGIAEQISNKAGTHGSIRQVNRCADCHHDHRGVDFDLTRSAYAHFDHSSTNFSLVWHQVGYDTLPIDCLACHIEEAFDSISLEGCVNCHAIEDFEFVQQHSADFGFECLACHDGSDVMSGFDHQATAFPLDGKHTQIACSACHTQAKPASEGATQVEDILQVFRQAPGECAKCHREPELHAGVFSARCEDCHTTLAWTPATLAGSQFNHFTWAGFSLEHHKTDYSGATISCKACHPADINHFEAGQCIPCHTQGEANSAFMDEHQRQFGSTCLECHDGNDRMRGFRHEDRFPLQDKHAEIACQDCHIEGHYLDTPAECVRCHAEPEIHSGYFGLKCQYCHDASAWSPAPLRIHNFPVGHGDQDGSDCKVCHQERYNEYTCYACHDHQPGPISESHLRVGITAESLPACADCHPAGRVEARP